MNYFGHIIVAFISVIVIFTVTNQPISLQVGAITLLGAVLPDIDHAKSKAFKFFLPLVFACVFSVAFNLSNDALAVKVLYGLVFGFLACAIIYLVKPRHHGIIHSFFAAAVFAAACFLLGGVYLALAGFTAFASHLAADGVLKAF